MEFGKKVVLYINIEAQLPDKPDQGMIGKKGGIGMPHTAWMDHNGDLLGHSYYGRFTSELAEKDLAHAIWAMGVYRKREEHPNDPLAQAEALIMDLYVKRGRPKFEELEKAAAVPGVDPRLLECFEEHKKYRPFREAIDEFEKSKGGTDKLKENACKKMFAVYKEGQKIADPGDSIFVNYWTMAFDGAILEKDKKGATSIREDFAKILAKLEKDMSVGDNVAARSPAPLRVLLKRMDADLKRLK